MKIFRKFLMIGAAVALLGVMAPVAAQEGGDGGIIIEGNLTSDVATMNPIMSSDTASSRVIAFMFPNFIGADPAQAVLAPAQPNSLATSWDISDDGLTYTFHLRDDLLWNDGTPITSADILYSWRAIQAGAEGLIDVPGSYVIDPTGASGIVDVTAPDDYTVVVQFASPECTALNYAASVVPAPSHVLPEDVTTLGDSEFNLAPSVTRGPFTFGEFRPGEQVSLLNDPTYPASDTVDGVVHPEGFIYRNVPDQTVMVEQFLAGELNVIDGPAVARRQDIRNSPATVYSYPGNAWDYLALNLADPNNPQNAFDEAGNPIDQGFHPIFGDVAVRQALARAIDVESIIDAAVFNEGERMTSFLIPASWAYADDLAPIPFDPEAAAQMLTDAGWVDADNDPSTPRVAQGAAHAEDGTEMVFTLYTNEGNTRREAIGTLVQDQLAQIGVQVDFQTIDFNTLLDIMDSQTFDSIILGWRNGYPDDPDATQLFTPASDVIGSGSNFTSFNNARFTELNAQAKSLPGCDPAERAAIYSEMQSIMQEELPYIWLFAQNGMYAANDIEGFDPYPAQLYWNADAWSVATP
jgi:peptide/nickel transport system substrate-binding protein